MNMLAASRPLQKHVLASLPLLCHPAYAAPSMMMAATSPQLCSDPAQKPQEWLTQGAQLAFGNGNCFYRGFAVQAATHQQPAPPSHPSSGDDHGKKDDSKASGAVLHPGLQKDSYLISNPYYTKEYMESVRPTHRPADTVHLKAGLAAVKVLRTLMDYVSGYGRGKMTEGKWLTRIIFLETVAGVPGMVAGMLRHMRSLRSMKHDNGWIHTLLEESENERMHLLTFMKVRSEVPPLWLRASVLMAQGVFFNMYLLAYIISPKTCHAMVGYLEEEAVKTYTHLLEEIDDGKVWAGKPAPQIAKWYWKLGEDAQMRDLVLAVRADEACHGHVNHTFSDLKATDANPFGPGGKSEQP